MNQIDKAHRILAEAEGSLRGAIESALAAQQYGDVAAIAQMADGIARLRSSDAERLKLSDRLVDLEAEPTDQVAQIAPRLPKKRRSVGDGYPRFEKDDDKLVKIGWSKRDDRVYEHRAPREVVFLVSAAIASRRRAKTVFTMDQVLPVKDDSGKEVPSYQAYLALAWLRSIGAVQRRGKDGYSMIQIPLDTEKLAQLWKAIPNKA